MERLNDYLSVNKQKKNINHRISLCGKLEAIIGNYFLSGAGSPDNEIRVLYYDSPDFTYDRDTGLLLS